MPSIINSTTTAGLSVQADNSGSLQLATNNGTTAVTIDTSQNVGIGTASPSNKLDLNVVGGLSAALRINGNDQSNVRLRLQNGGSGGRTYELTGGQVGANNSSFSIYDVTADSTRLLIDSSGNLAFNSGYGSAGVAYGCRAWVNFNGTGTVAIRASGNVSSITDVNTGNYIINFATAMPDTNYSTILSGQETSNGRDGFYSIRFGGAYSTSAVQILGGVLNAYNTVDNAIVCVAIFR